MENLTRIVLGPRTRLGQAIMARPPAAGEHRVVLARHEADAAALASYDAEVLSTDADKAAIQAVIPAHGPLLVQICALGPLHPGVADQARDSANVARDLGAVGRILDAAGGRPTRVVLVSTVLALAPQIDRSYYAGWRGVVEQELRQLVSDKSPSSGVSVLYPGRLTETRDPRHASSLLYTSYRRLAELADRAGHAAPESRVVGLDARAWLLARSASLGLSSLVGRRMGDGSIADRTVRATRHDPSTRER